MLSLVILLVILICTESFAFSPVVMIRSNKVIRTSMARPSTLKKLVEVLEKDKEDLKKQKEDLKKEKEDLKKSFEKDKEDLKKDKEDLKKSIEKDKEFLMVSVMIRIYTCSLTYTFIV